MCVAPDGHVWGIRSVREPTAPHWIGERPTLSGGLYLLARATGGMLSPAGLRWRSEPMATDALRVILAASEVSAA